MNIVGIRKTALMSVGDLTCPGVDVVEFGRKCRIPMFPDKWNVWRMARSGDNNLSQADLEKEALQTLRRWFIKPSRDGDFFHERFKPAAGANAFGTAPIISRFACSTPITTAGDSILFIDVAFVFRGSQKNRGWPVLKQLTPDVNPVFNEGVICPTDATWVVDTVFQPLKEAVPDESEDKGAIDKITEDIGSIGKGLVIVAAAIGIIALIAVLK